MKYTLNQMRAALPENVAKIVAGMMSEKRLGRVTIAKADKFYPGEDHAYTTIQGTEARDTRVGGEWGGLENIRAIGKVVPIPVGAYVIESAIFLGKWGIAVYHNSGEQQIAA